MPNYIPLYFGEACPGDLAAQGLGWVFKNADVNGITVLNKIFEVMLLKESVFLLKINEGLF
jgi:hypothetical protein